ncbi:MAG: LicD family protein [Lachnospiraceae bacterium]|nr:LicD family protein [Lachnospiraceae bacterium]
MREYDEATLKRLQKLELGILKDFIAVCKEYDLTYFAFAGTGIGALRHQGFIPWDDDIDVGLPRKDYEKLIEIFKEKFRDKYQIANAECMPNYPLMTTRIMIKGTKFVEEAIKDANCDLGIFLDVYAYDNVSDDDKEMKKQARITWFWSKVLILRFIPKPVLPFTGVTKEIISLVCVMIHAMLVMFRISPKWIYMKCKNASCKYNDVETERLAYLCDTSPYINMINRKKSFPLIELEFEGIKVAFQKDIDESLRLAYGDYMTLPPIEKRKNHFPYCLEFGDEV